MLRRKQMTPAKIKILMIIATFKHPTYPHIDIKPTVREIATLAGSSSTTVHEHLQVLLKDRWLKKCTQVNSKRVYALTAKAKDLLFDTVLDQRHDMLQIVITAAEKIIEPAKEQTIAGFCEKIADAKVLLDELYKKYV